MVSPRCHPYGGVEKFVKVLSEELLKRGFEVEIFATDPSLKQSYRSLFIDGVRTTVFKSHAPGETIYFSLAMFARLREVKADVVHVHGYRALTMLEAALSKRSNGRLVVTTHLGFSKLGKWVYGFYNPTLGRFVLSRADSIVAVSPAEIVELPILRKFRDRVRWIPIGISLPKVGLEPFKRLGEKLELLYVGRIEAKKGLITLLKLMHGLDCERFRLTIVGSGPYERQLVNDIRRLGLKNVEFVGRVSEEQLHKLYGRSSVFLLLSEYEGHSVALTEAMAFSLTPIATDVGGNRYVLSSDSGFLIKYPVDTVDVASILHRLFDRRDELVNKALNARRRAEERFSMEKVLDMHVKLYEEACNR